MVRKTDNDVSGARNGDATGRKPWMTTLESRLTKAEGSLNSSRTRLLRSIVENAEDNYFLSSRALAKRYEVDKATIVRTIQALGYERYADFAADLRAHFVSRLTPYTLMKSAAREKRSVADHVEHSVEMDMHNLNALQSRSGLAPSDPDGEAPSQCPPHHGGGRRFRRVALLLCWPMRWYLSVTMPKRRQVPPATCIRKSACWARRIC